MNLTATVAGGICLFMAVWQGRAAGGYTLIEIVFVLAIMAVLAAIAVPNWSTLLPTYYLNSGARQVESELHRIKSQAVSENVTFQLVFSASNDNYTVQRVVGSTPTDLAIKPLPEGVDVRNAVTLGFTSRGTSSGNTLMLCNIKNQGYNLVVSSVGRIRMCKPSACDASC